MNSFLLGAVLTFFVSSSFGNELLRYVDQHGEKFDSLALELWDYAELGYLESRSSTKLQQVLAADGFEIQAGVAGIPTAFIASFGKGKPVIGILAEFDALPGISQAAVSSRQLLEGKESGHACGHHLLVLGRLPLRWPFGTGWKTTTLRGRSGFTVHRLKRGVPVKFI